MSNTWGRKLKITIFGESHGEAIGVVIDGFPPGFKIDENYIKAYMSKRTAKNPQISTARFEADNYTILSGVFNGFTCGTPICATIANKNTHSSDYQPFVPRPSHADFTAHIKYNGFEDYRGGGHFSGRLTAPLVFAGAIATSFLQKQGINISAHIAKIGKINDDLFSISNLNDELLSRLNNCDFPLINPLIEGEMKTSIKLAKDDLNSVGGEVECVATGLPIGMGSPFFNSLESSISSLMFSIPAVKAIEFGDGFNLCEMFGSEANDQIYCENDKFFTKTNHNGGINGGISNGMPVVLKAGIKPTPSIGKDMHTVNLSTQENVIIKTKGRHDPCIVPRALIAIKSALAIALTDEFLIYNGEKNA